MLITFVVATLLFLGVVFEVGEKNVERQIEHHADQLNVSPPIAYVGVFVPIAGGLFALWSGGLLLIASATPPASKKQ